MLKLWESNPELIIAAILIIVALIRTTSWGKANKSALDSVAEVIENAGKDDIRAAVDEKKKALPPAAQDALNDAQDKADPCKAVPLPSAIVAREVVRTVDPTFDQKLAAIAGRFVAERLRKDRNSKRR